MVIVAIAALNFGAIRAAMDQGPTHERLAMGVIPMANFLAVGLLLGFRRRISRPFLLGFELFGATVLASYSIVASLFSEEVVFPYLNSVIQPLSDFFGRPHTPAELLVLYSIATLMLGLPQLVSALAGGLLFRAFGIAERPDHDHR
jgi:hypothetical protein